MIDVLSLVGRVLSDNLWKLVKICGLSFRFCSCVLAPYGMLGFIVSCLFACSEEAVFNIWDAMFHDSRIFA